MPIELADLQELLCGMENRLQKNMKEQFQDFEQRMDQRFVDLEQRMDQRFVDLEQSLLGKMDVIAKQTQQNSLDIHHLSIMMTATERQLNIHSVQLTKLTAYVDKRQKQAGKKSKNSKRAHHPFKLIHSPHQTPRKDD